MSDPVTVERHGDIALITLNNPPVNALAQPVRAGLLAAVVAADDDPKVKAIAIRGAGRNFIAGADIRELDRPPLQPLLNDVLLRVEACRKPVIAALHGMVLGGGFETALACHYRCASPDVQIGLPEIKLALLPGAGGTQRLPRAIGVKAALDMMTSGDPISFERARDLALLDHALDETHSLDSVLAYARDLVASNASPRRFRDAPILDREIAAGDYFSRYLEALPRSVRKLPAASRILECVQAAVTLPFEDALALSRKHFEACRSSTESSALRYLFFAERGTRGPAVEPREIEHVCVIGAGTMGSGIAVSCATGGYSVTLIDTQPAALDSGLKRAYSMIDAGMKKGKLSAGAAQLIRSRIVSASQIEAARDADLVIEAVFESADVKREVFGKLDSICRSGAILATNTSTLDIDRIADSTRRPGDVLGMHFFSPAHVMKLVEIVRGKDSSDQAIATALAVTKRIGKLGVVVGNCFGFVGNRMLYAYGEQNQKLMLEGASPEQVDRALEAWGMAMGPNAVGDLAGLDVGYRVRRERNMPHDPAYFRVSDMLAELGRYGQKTGRGFYLYDERTRARTPDPEVIALIRGESQRLGIPQRTIENSEIVQRCIGALVAEGEIILREGIAASADDIDVIWCNGYGFPRSRGGPMFHSRHAGGPSEDS